MLIGKTLGSLAARLILAFFAVALLSSATLFAISFYERKRADETAELRAIEFVPQLTSAAAAISTTFD